MSNKHISVDGVAGEVLKTQAHNWLNEEYITYALYTIYDRALLMHDGLKPVGRRLIWDMFSSNILPNSSYVKAARIVGSTMGKFHPHGDSSIAEHLATLAQNFSLRVPLVDAFGSVGFVSGDDPAAPRYWEARLTKAGVELVKETKEGAVELVSNFDGTEVEPEVLPVRWPNDVINGTQGMAVGFASNIPPHNPNEVMKAVEKLVKNPDMTADDLLKIMQGPDFPTGGEIIEVEGIKDYYETGNGRFAVRGRYKIEPLTRGRVRIVFYELPFKVSPESVKDKIASLMTEQTKTVGGKKTVVAPNPKFAKGIADVQDFTDKKNGLKVVITTTQGTNYNDLLNELFKKTPLQEYFSVNSTVISNNRPMRVGILDMLRNFIEFRKQCIANRSLNRLNKIDARLEQLNAILAISLDIDRAIAIIRGADDSEIAKKELQEAFSINETQADYILSVRLRRLTKSDSLAIVNESDELKKEHEFLLSVLNDGEVLKDILVKEIRETAKVIASDRRSVITGITSSEIKAQEKEISQTAKENNRNVTCYVTRFADGSLLKTLEPFSYDFMSSSLKYGPIVEQIKMKSQDNLVIVGSDGYGYRTSLNFMLFDTVSSAESAGVSFSSKDVRTVGIAKFDGVLKTDVGLAIATKQGFIKIAKTDFPNKESFPVFSLSDGDEIADCRWINRTTNNTLFAMVSAAGNVITFDARSINVTGSKAGGVKGMKLKSDDDYVKAFSWVQNAKETSLVTLTNSTIKRTPFADIPVKGRAGLGVATQIFRAGEQNFIKEAFIGVNLIACVPSGKREVVALPPLTKRTSRGTEFGFDVKVGSLTLVQESGSKSIDVDLQQKSDSGDVSLF